MATKESIEQGKTCLDNIEVIQDQINHLQKGISLKISIRTFGGPDYEILPNFFDEKRLKRALLTEMQYQLQDNTQLLKDL